MNDKFSYQKRKILCILISFAVIALLSIFLASIILVLNLRHVSMNEYSENSEIHKIKYLKYNPSKNETAISIFSNPGDYRTHQKSSFLDKDGTYHVFSNFEEDFYECKGECYCEDKDDGLERRSASVLSRGIMVVFAAISTIIAVNFAQEELRKKCVDLFSSRQEKPENQNSLFAPSQSDSCPDQDHISARLWGCETKEDEELLERINDFGFGKKKTTKAWVCRGNCQNNPRYKREDILEAMETMDCEGFQLAGEMRAYFGSPLMRESEAKKFFMERKLDPFCISKSLATRNGLKNLLRGKKGDLHLCSGWSKGKINPTIICYDMGKNMDKIVSSGNRKKKIY